MLNFKEILNFSENPVALESLAFIRLWDYSEKTSY